MNDIMERAEKAAAEAKEHLDDTIKSGERIVEKAGQNAERAAKEAIDGAKKGDIGKMVLIAAVVVVVLGVLGQIAGLVHSH